jgi:Xaa-Pro aminopeptidase
MSTYADRLAALRDHLKQERLDGFVVPLTDEHMSEYVGSYAQRLAWLTGFEGSAGSAVVLPEEAAIFTDGRYTLQVRQQVDEAHWSYQAVPETSIAKWLKEHAPEGARIGYDPWLHRKDWVVQASEALKARGASLVAVADNPIDRVWADRPEASKAALAVHPEKFAGQSSADKRQKVADWLESQKADAAVLAALDSIAWTFNVRGTDVSHTPVALAYALVHGDGTADLFVAGEKVLRSFASILAMASGCTSGRRSKVRLQNSAARRWRLIRSARWRQSSKRWRRRAPRSSRCAIRRCFRGRARTRRSLPDSERRRCATARRSLAS